MLSHVGSGTSFGVLVCCTIIRVEQWEEGLERFSALRDVA